MLKKILGYIRDRRNANTPTPVPDPDALLQATLSIRMGTESLTGYSEDIDTALMLENRDLFEAAVQNYIRVYNNVVDILPEEETVVSATPREITTFFAALIEFKDAGPQSVDIIKNLQRAKKEANHVG